jgi:hypothetical protein
MNGELPKFYAAVKQLDATARRSLCDKRSSN